jgi:hypothetical protein
MEIHNNDIRCYAGESFTLDFDIRNQDGSPYILWSGYDNNDEKLLEQMFILFTISDDKDNIVKRYWLDCNIAYGELDDLFPRFDSTQIYELSSGFVTLVDGVYEGTLPEGHHARTCVYKLQNTDKYLYVKSIDTVNNICTFDEYRLRIAIPLITEDTQLLVKMNYSYNLLLTDSNSDDYNILSVLLSPHKFTVLNAYRR